MAEGPGHRLVYPSLMDFGYQGILDIEAKLQTRWSLLIHGAEVPLGTRFQTLAEFLRRAPDLDRPAHANTLMSHEGKSKESGVVSSP
jgi:hypothetical protein